MGGLLHLALPSPLLAVPNVTAHPTTASVPINVLLNDGPLHCGFNVAIKGLSIKATIHKSDKKQRCLLKHGTKQSKQSSNTCIIITHLLIFIYSMVPTPLMTNPESFIKVAATVFPLLLQLATNIKTL